MQSEKPGTDIAQQTHHLGHSPARTCVVDKNVDATKGLHSSVDAMLGKGLSCHIPANCYRLTTNIPDLSGNLASPETRVSPRDS